MTSGPSTVLPDGAGHVRSDIDRADEPWWLAAPGVLQAVEQRPFVSRAAASYRFGDAVLQMDADDPELLAAFPALYGDCAATGVQASGVATVRCTLRRNDEPPLVVLTFDEGAPADPAAIAHNLLRPTKTVPPFRVWDSPQPGWRLAGGATGPLLAACGAHVLLDPTMYSPEFPVEYLVGITLGAQPGMLPIHGAAVLMGEAGIVLVGASHSSKTTTSLYMGARGHTLLGDEVALIRLATTEIVPFRRAVNLRPGPRGLELAAVLGLPTGNGASSSAEWVGRHRITRLFPDRPARSAPLRAVFFLAGFAERPSLEPFRLTLDRPDVFGWITTPEIAYASWGIVPARRAFRLMVLKQVLSRVPCWLVKVGPPHDTVALIERTMEELRC